MKSLFYIIAGVIVFSISTFAQAQKGIDTQTQKIKEEGNKTTNKGNDVSRSWDWGKGKTKTRDLLDNPYQLNSRRDVLVNNIIEILKDQKMIVDESASRLNEGIVVTHPFVFAKGPVTTRNALSRYALLPNADSAWTRGRYTLTIEVQSIDGIRNNVSVLAKVEGRSESGLVSEWTTLQSTGVAEDEFLVKLVEMITGTTPEGMLQTEPRNNP